MRFKNLYLNSEMNITIIEKNYITLLNALKSNIIMKMNNELN